MTLRQRIVWTLIYAFLFLAASFGVYMAPLEHGGFTLHPAYAQSLPNPVYICKCDTGAHADCAANAGSDAVAIGSTSAATPRATITVSQFNALAAGTRVLACRGGAWLNMNLIGVINTNATLALPVGIDEYVPPNGSPTGQPWFQVTNGQSFIEHGPYCGEGDVNCAVDGGYFYRNFRFSVTSGSTPSFGLWVRRGVRGVLQENLTTSGFGIPFFVQSGTGGNAATGYVLRGSTISGVSMGLHGTAHDMLVEDNAFVDTNLNQSQTDRQHAIYIGSSGMTTYRVTVRRNTFDNISMSGGTCRGGNFTVHGQYDGLKFEHNTIRVSASGGGCVGVSITRGYATSEWFRNVRVAHNTIVNADQCITWSAAPGIVVEGNECIWTQAIGGSGISWPSVYGGSNPVNDPDGNAIIRNNTCLYSALQAGDGSTCLNFFSGFGTGHTVVSNMSVMLSGSTSTVRRCWGSAGSSTAPKSAFPTWDNNICFGQGGTRWSDQHSDHSAARVAGFDTWSAANGPAWANPNLVDTSPTNGEGWNTCVQAGSAAIDNGHEALSMRLSKEGFSPDGGRRDIGACEKNKDPS